MKIIYYLILISFLNCKKTTKEKSAIRVEINKLKESNNKTAKEKNTVGDEIKIEESNKKKVKEFKYIIAKSGLLYREKPKGKVLGKFEYGEEIEIIEKTGVYDKVSDSGKKLYDEWLFVKTNLKKGYVFGAYLKTEKEFNIINKKNNIRFYPLKKTIKKEDEIISNLKISITDKLLNTSVSGYIIKENGINYNLRYRDSEITLRIEKGNIVLLDTILRKENFKNINKDFLKIANLDYSFSKKENNKLKFFGMIIQPDTDISYPFYHYFDIKTQKLSIEEIEEVDEVIR